MYKDVLVISDNPYLSQRLFELIRKQNLQDNFSFSISPFSKKSDFDFLESERIGVYDFRLRDDVMKVRQKFDLILSLHCKQIFPQSIVENIKCINIHPGYNPINRGWYPQVFAILHNLPIGATIHEIDNKLDNGKIIARELVNKEIYDTSETLYQKIIHKEIELMEKHLISIVQGNYTSFSPEGEGNIFLKKDFRKLLEIDLNEIMSVGKVIDRIRALSHGDYRNLYFIDPETKRKIFVKLSLSPEENGSED